MIAWSFSLYNCGSALGFLRRCLKSPVRGLRVLKEVLMASEVAVVYSGPLGYFKGP